MIRALALALLCANLVLLGVGLLRAPDLPARGSGVGAAAAALPPGAETLRLLTEVPAAEGPIVNGPAATPEPGGPGAAAAAVVPGAGASGPEPATIACRSVGPLATLDDARAVVERARSLGIDGAITVRDVAEGTPDRQVLLPPEPSLDQARRLVRELAALDVEAFVVDRGPLAGSVSVGVFSDPGRAADRVEALAALGYEARQRELPRTRSEHRVRLGAADLAALEAFVPTLAGTWPELAAEPCAPDPPRADG